MEINNIPEEEAIYSKVAQSLKDRMTTYITESKLSGKKETDSFRKLIEISVDEYIINHPIAIKQKTHEKVRKDGGKQNG